MAADVNDYFQKVGMATATTLSAPGYTTGATSINVGSTTNWPTTTGVTFAIDETETVDGEEVRVSGTYNVFRGTVNTATQVTNVTYVGGDANRNYSAGATTRVYILVSSYRDNRLVDGILTEHNQDGTHDEALIQSRTADTAPASGDYILTSDVSDSNALKKVTLSNLGSNGTWIAAGGIASNAVTGAKLGQVIGCRLTKSSTQSISDNTETNVTWDTETWDTDSMHSTSSNTERITATTAGIYLITAYLNWASSGSGSRFVTISKSGVGTIARQNVGSTASGAGECNASVAINLAVGDYVTISCYQNSGGSLNLSSTATSVTATLIGTT